MPKRVTVRQFIANQHELATGEDRGAGLAAVGLLEHYIGQAIQSKFRQTSNEKNKKIFSGYGPLATLAARIDIAYCLDILSDAQYEDLGHIKWIRNNLAHRSDNVDFDTKYIRDRIKLLSNFQEKTIPETNYRKTYIDAVMSIIVTASHDGTARLWDAANGAQIGVLEGHSDWVIFASFSPDGSRVVTAGNNRRLRGEL